MMRAPEENFEQQLYLKEIGTSLEDFKEVHDNDKQYYILRFDNLGYDEKMLGKDNKYYTVKKLYKSCKKFSKIDLKRITQIPIKLKHENLARFYGYFEDKEKIEKLKEIKIDLIKKFNNKELYFGNGSEDVDIYCLVMEFSQNGSLEDFINKYKNDCEAKGIFVPLDEEIVIKFLEQSLSALKYLHENKIVHRNIKPTNIQLDENNNIKISEFYFTAIFNEEDDTEIEEDDDLLCHCTKIKENEYNSPEIKQGKDYDYRCDIYSLGLIMLNLILKDNISYFGGENKKQKKKCRNREELLDNLSFYNKYLIKLIKRMIEKRIDNRPTSSECYDVLQMIKYFIKNPDDEGAEKYLENINDPKKRKSKEVNIKIPIPKSNSEGQKSIQQYNQYNQINMQINYNRKGNSYDNSNNFRNALYQNQLPYNYNLNNSIYNPNFYQNYSMNNYYYCQNNLYYQNYSNFSKNSSIISVIQCLYYCFKDGHLTCFDYCTLNKGLFSYDIAGIIEKVNLEKQNNFLNSIQNFRNRASQIIPKFYNGTEEIEPMLAFLGMCSYINKEFKEQNNICQYFIFRDFKEMKDVPRLLFPKVYEKIEAFIKEYHDPFAYNFYFILLNLIKCPKCNYVLNAEIKDEYGVSSFISFNGLTAGKVSDLLKQYMSKLTNYSHFTYYCYNCKNYNPGKNEVEFLNSPKYLLFQFEGGKQITLDNSIDLSNYSLEKLRNNKYNLLSFIAKENNKFKAYIKIDRHTWTQFNEENIMENNIFITKYIPYIAIYEKEI